MNPGDTTRKAEPHRYTIEFVGGPWDGHVAVFDVAPKPYMSPISIQVDEDGRPITQEIPVALYRCRSVIGDLHGSRWTYDYDRLTR